ncbi:two-component system sensor histidine kinase NtrB [Methylocystis sp. JAN1]|uniref:two-component system sensor histidine kinase NtrB n=1 Tax=Methylocystis sp. JAN1 TaxID=3397211 RepID=UPI003FA1D785
MSENSEAAYLAAVVKAALDGIVVIDGTGCVLSFNPMAARLFGYAPEEVIGQNIGMLMPEPYRSEHDHYISNYLATGHARIIGTRRQVEGRRKDGSVFPMELGISEVENAGARYFVGFIHDLSEREKFEARMRDLHENRLALIENMTVGLAHELRQPLAAINAYLNAARRLLKEDERDVGKAIESASEQTFRVSDILENLRQFISRGETVKTHENLNEIVRDACEFTDAMARSHRVTTMTRLEAQHDRVIANRVQIQQVLINLKRNAIEAMQACERRELIVSTFCRDERFVQVDVADSGSGVLDGVKERLFEPFTTSKEHGLGVGLSISRSIIEAHNGRLWAEANPGGGMIFSFTLPLADDAAIE